MTFRNDRAGDRRVSGGLGSAIAKSLGGAGRAAGAVGLQPDQAGSLRQGAWRRSCDAGLRPFRTPQQVDQLVPRAVEALGGKLDILVNNAGVTRDNLAMRMKDEEWDQVIKVNLEAAFRLMRAAMKPMMKARHGRIINITSVVGVTGNPGQANYVASKAGLIGMSKAFAQEVASRGITVNCVAPGFMTSAMTDALNDAAEGRDFVEDSDRRDGQRRGYWRGCRLPGFEGSRLRHRADPARQWRHGDAVMPQAGQFTRDCALVA